MKCFISVIFILFLFLNFSYAGDLSILCDSSFLRSTTVNNLNRVLLTVRDRNRGNQNWISNWLNSNRGLVDRTEFLQICDEVTGDTPLHLAARVGAGFGVMDVLIRKERGYTQYPLSDVILRRNAEGQTPFEILRERVEQHLSTRSIDNLDTLLRLYALYYIYLG